MALVKTKGIVLRERAYQEQDKLLTIFTENQGKVRAIAKGVRRSKSAMVAATQLFAYSEFVYYPGKNFANINTADLVESYYPLQNNLIRMSLASYILELIDAFYDFYQGNRAVFKLVTYILYYMAYNKSKNDEALAASLALKLCEVGGIMPILSTCARCEKNDVPQWFSIENNGVLCHNCGDVGGYTYRIDGAIRDTMLFLTQSPIKIIRETEFDAEQISRILKIMNHYIEYVLSSKLGTYAFYESIKPKGD